MDRKAPDKRKANLWFKLKGLQMIRTYFRTTHDVSEWHLVITTAGDNWNFDKLWGVNDIHFYSHFRYQCLLLRLQSFMWILNYHNARFLHFLTKGVSFPHVAYAE